MPQKSLKVTTGLQSEIEKVNPLTREHQSYFIGSERVPSVTTVLANLGWKYPALMGWQAKMLRLGIDPDAAKTEAGTVGTLVHTMIQANLTGKEVDYQFFSAEQKRLADKAFGGFLDWFQENKIEPIGVEVQLTHLRLRFGGTIDLWCKMNGKYTLVDHKSATAVFLDHRIQLAAYSELVTHRYKKKHDLLILHLNKENGIVTPHLYPSLRDELEAFKLCLRLENLHRRLK